MAPKLQALCLQVAQALQMSLPADLGLELLGVAPDSDPSRLIVLLQASDRETDLPQARERLAGLQGQLREEVARAITRKRVPELVLQLSPVTR